MNEQSDPGSRPNDGKPGAADDSGTHYLKSLCDRRDAAVLNPFIADETVTEAEDADQATDKPSATPTHTP